MTMNPVDGVVNRLSSEGLGFERIELLHGSTFKDVSTVLVIPTRGMIHMRVVAAWEQLIRPMNQKRGLLFASGDEVGVAYNKIIATILADPTLSKWKYILTLEDDNLPPADAHIRLLESIDAGFDAVSGLYFTKGDINMPMAYGDPETYRTTGVIDFQPLAMAPIIKAEATVEVNGIAMGCALWRLDLFRQIPPPWFVTVNDIVPNQGAVCFTQDLYFCERARRAGKRFAVDTRVRVGHLDVGSGLVY